MDKKKQAKPSKPANEKKSDKKTEGELPDADLDKVSGGYVEQDNLKKPFIEQDNRRPR